MTEPHTENENTPPGKSADWARSPWLQGAALFVLVFAGMLFYQFVPAFTDDGLRSTSAGLGGADGYYHIKMGYLYRTGEVPAAGAEFHWTRESVWGEAFSDKDFLFHVYLAPFTLLADGPDDATGLIQAARLATSLLGALLVLVMYAVLRLFGVRHAWLFALGLIVVGGTYFVFRMNLCRSYVASVIFALVGWTLIVKQHRRGAFFLAAVYTLAYTASHLLLAMLIVRAVMELLIGPREGGTRLKDLKAHGAMGACILGGIALGCVLHPNSIELVRLWWIQNVVVLALSHQDSVAPVLDNITAIFGGDTGYSNAVGNLELGSELDPTLGTMAVFGAPLVLLTPMLLPLIASVVGWRPTREAILTATMAVVWLLLYLLNARFIEYAAPFMTLAAGIWLTGILQSEGYANWAEKRRVAGRALPIGSAAVVLVAGVAIWIGGALAYRTESRGEIAPAGEWLHENERAHGKVVWHDRWDDFTQLMFYASECDYLVGLDPTFFYVHDREKYETWWAIRKGQRREFIDTIREDFEADYILAHRSSSAFFYNRLNEEARAGRLKLCIRDSEDDWALYEITAGE